MPKTDTAPLRIVILISGNGSNLQAIIDTAHHDQCIKICAVISNRGDSYGLKRAAAAGIQTHTVEHFHFSDRCSFDLALQKVIDQHQPELLVLAGFMRILTSAFVHHYHGRMLNIHPSLLPDFPGLNTHQRALDAGKKEHGVSIHFVTPELDGGPVIMQATVAIERGDNAAQLAAKVRRQEHRLYPLAIRWFAQGRLRLTASGVELDAEPLKTPVVNPFAINPLD